MRKRRHTAHCSVQVLEDVQESEVGLNPSPTKRSPQVRKQLQMYILKESKTNDVVPTYEAISDDAGVGRQPDGRPVQNSSCVGRPASQGACLTGSVMVVMMAVMVMVVFMVLPGNSED